MYCVGLHALDKTTSADWTIREASLKVGLLGLFLLALATTAAAPQTQLDELIARALHSLPCALS
jgi:hypothetical protein